MAKLIINEENKKSRIEPEIYGHFSEHLGRCIYEGIYVGEKSEIPNVNGMRTDVVDALKELKVPVLRWPGGCFADEYHWMDAKHSHALMINRSPASCPCSSLTFFNPVISQYTTPICSPFHSCSTNQSTA